MTDSPTTLCFISSKGGSGKTVTSSALGTLLSQLGLHVLLVDTDAATNGMTLLFLDHLLKEKSIGPIRGIETGLFEASKGQPAHGIDISSTLRFVPATYHLSNATTIGVDRFDNNIRQLLEDAGGFDCIILDAQAGSDDFALTAASVADQCVIVSEYDPVSAQGIDRLKLIFGSILEPGKTWTLFNKVLPEFASSIGEGLSIARYLPPIPWDADVVRAFARSDLALNSVHPNSYTLAIAQIALALLPEIARAPLERWQGAALERVTSPLERRLEEVLHQKSALEDWLRHQSTLRQIVDASLVISIISCYAGMFMLIDQYPNIAGYVLFLTFVLTTVFTFRTYLLPILRHPKWRQSRREEEREEAVRSLEAEVSNISLSLAASKAALSITGERGYYEKYRADHLGIAGIDPV